MVSYEPVTKPAGRQASPLIVSTALPAIQDLQKKRNHFDELQQGMLTQSVRRNQRVLQDGEQPPSDIDVLNTFLKGREMRK